MRTLYGAHRPGARHAEPPDLRPAPAGVVLSLRGLACLAALLAAPGANCGSGVAGPPLPGSPGRGKPAPWLPDPAGHWRWTMVSEEPGIRRIEVERWHIEGQGRALAGTLARTVTVLSTDGVPFACNQALAYRQEAVYRLEGQRDGQGFWLREAAHQTLPSPCDDGQRTRIDYRGRWVAGALALTWNGGSQTLQRMPAPVDAPASLASAAGRDSRNRPSVPALAAPAPAAPAPAAPALAAPAPAAPAPAAPAPAAPALAAPAPPGSPALAGSWRWQSRDTRPDTGEVRVEIEDWVLEEDPAGQLVGTVTQTVTVFDRDGRVFGCSGDTFYRYRDRYTVAGQRRGEALTVREVAVAAEDHPCLHGASRHLDTATGALIGEHVVLTWRGQRRQVLHRP